MPLSHGSRFPRCWRAPNTHAVGFAWCLFVLRHCRAASLGPEYFLADGCVLCPRVIVQRGAPKKNRADLKQRVYALLASPPELTSDSRPHASLLLLLPRQNHGHAVGMVPSLGHRQPKDAHFLALDDVRRVCVPFVQDHIAWANAPVPHNTANPLQLRLHARLLKEAHWIRQLGHLHMLVCLILHFILVSILTSNGHQMMGRGNCQTLDNVRSSNFMPSTIHAAPLVCQANATIYLCCSTNNWQPPCQPRYRTTHPQDCPHH